MVTWSFLPFAFHVYTMLNLSDLSNVKYVNEPQTSKSNELVFQLSHAGERSKKVLQFCTSRESVEAEGSIHWL